MKDLKNVASLIQKSVFGKKSEYELQFNHEADGCWYVDFPGWPFDHHNLMMVAPAILTSKVVMERNIMKRVITLLLISLTLWGCRHAADSKGDEQVVGQEDVVLNDEEIEDVVSAFSLYLKDSIDEDYMRGAMSNAAEISQRYSDEEWDDAIYKENVDKVDSLMKEGIRLAKANDYDSLLSLVENLDMWDIYICILPIMSIMSMVSTQRCLRYIRRHTILRKWLPSSFLGWSIQSFTLRCLSV